MRGFTKSKKQPENKPLFVAFPECQMVQNYDRFYRLQLRGGEYLEVLRHGGQIGIFIFSSASARDYQLSFIKDTGWQDAEVLFVIDGITETAKQKNEITQAALDQIIDKIRSDWNDQHLKGIVIPDDVGEQLRQWEQTIERGAREASKQNKKK